MRTCPVSALCDFAVSAFVVCGLDAEDALKATEALCFADLRGNTTHGTFNLTTIYAPRLIDRRISAQQGPSSVVVDGGASVLLDGRNRLGLLVGTEAIDLAVDRARAHGVAAVAVRNSTHFGAAGFYAARAAAAGTIGIALTNCGAQAIVPPPGGIERMLGTNPIAAAAPTKGDAPFILDGSTTAVAAGKVRAAQRSGRSIPEGWLRRLDGTATTDPAAYEDGTAELAWLGGKIETGAAKGFGLGLLVELLAGALPGAALGTSADERADHDVGHFFLAINPAAFSGAAAFTTAADTALARIAAASPAPGADRVRYPGMIEAERFEHALAHGAELSADVATALDELAAQLDLAPIAWTE
jgi:LDH2 family malate/lactate/ureidoglycolate dehydrogenase